MNPGGRHPFLAELCTHLELLHWGVAAADLLTDTAALPERACLVHLPMWRWCLAGADVGRKDRNPAGGRYLLPVRVRWDTPPVTVLDPDTPAVLSWRAAGLGHDTTGTAHVPEPDPTTGDPAPTARVLTREELIAALREAVAAGRDARWDLYTQLGGHLRLALRSAATAVTREVYGPERAGCVVGEHDLDDIETKMTLDSGGSLDRIVTKCLAPTTFERVEPLRWITVALRRDASQAVRRHIGDPAVGPKVRALFREGRFEDMDTFLAAYAARHPGDRLGPRRAATALLVPMSVDPGRRVSLDPDSLTDHAHATSHEDAVIARVDAARARRAA